MENKEILELHRQRDERAIEAVSKKYGRYLMKIAGNFLQDPADKEECINDVLYRFWNGTVPENTDLLSAYLAALTREVCIDCYRRNHRQKRINSEFTVSLTELSELLPDSSQNPEDLIGGSQLSQLISRYLSERPAEIRRAFLMRYYYMDSVHDIAKTLGTSRARIYNVLSRERKRLKVFLEREGYELY